MKRREATTTLLAIGVAAAAAAQPAGQPPRIAFLGLSSAADYAPYVDAFLQGLRELGYEDGRNITIVYRWADGQDQRLPELAAQLVQLRPAVIVSHATGVRAAQQVTPDIPIVMGVSADPVAQGLIKSLARPGGNTTGVTSQLVELASKRLELLKEVVPRLNAVAVLSHRSTPAHAHGLAETEAAARKLGVRVRALWVEGDAGAIDSALDAVARERPQGLIVQPDSLTGRHGARIAAIALRYGLPTIGGGRQFVTDGGLASYGSDFQAGWRIAARFVDKILRGAKPADLPVEQPTAFELALNLRTANALGLALPPSLLLRADIVVR